MAFLGLPMASLFQCAVGSVNDDVFEGVSTTTTSTAFVRSPTSRMMMMMQFDSQDPKSSREIAPTRRVLFFLLQRRIHKARCDGGTWPPSETCYDDVHRKCTCMERRTGGSFVVLFMVQLFCYPLYFGFLRG